MMYAMYIRIYVNYRIKFLVDIIFIVIIYLFYSLCVRI